LVGVAADAAVLPVEGLRGGGGVTGFADEGCEIEEVFAVSGGGAAEFYLFLGDEGEVFAVGGPEGAGEGGVARIEDGVDGDGLFLGGGEGSGEEEEG